ncbi:MAG: hypothetical protein K2W82_16405 [Candidatus Obscuribacterales bacterium]|nr:hypothetical protein [Candidatus Obscuribacterales bacterium]
MGSWQLVVGVITCCLQQRVSVVSLEDMEKSMIADARFPLGQNAISPCGDEPQEVIVCVISIDAGKLRARGVNVDLLLACMSCGLVSGDGLLATISNLGPDGFNDVLEQLVERYDHADRHGYSQVRMALSLFE